jgi:thioesterase domain-containing protein
LAVSEAHKKAEGGLPVGTPPEGLEVAVVRPDGSPADVGETGAIAISSPHVATGYLNRPELDAEAFADVPGRPGWRRYTSADLGFIDADGNLNFIGRSGSRIKLRGQAIDLAEVEAALHDCPGVTGAVVLPKMEAGEEAREILAFVTLAPGVAAEAGDIRKQLAEALPPYMLPSGYVILDKFPQTATSKVDRRALEAMDLDAVRYRPGYAPPENETETKVAAIFGEILDAQGVGRLDDFFLLGGDSLSLVNLQLLASQTFGRQFAKMHEDATVKGIAQWLDSGEEEGSSDFPILVPVQPNGSNPPLFVVHGRRGQAQVGPHFLKLLGEEQPFYALQARGLDGKREPHGTIQEMAEEYVAAIKTVQPRGTYFIGGFCAGCYIALEMIRLLQAGGDRAYSPLLIDPPLPQFKKGQRMSDRVLIRGIKKRAVTGEWKVDVGNSALIDAALKVARAIDDALAAYDVQIPKVRSIIIATIERWRAARYVKQYFGDQVHVFMVDGQHREMLTPDNKQFAAAIRQSIAHIAKVAAERRGKGRTAAAQAAE